MDNKLYTHNYTKLGENVLSKKIKSDLALVRNYFSGQEVQLLQTSTKHLVIAFTVEVNMPMRGAVNGVPLKRHEPIFLVLDKNLYPYLAPMAFSDRKDFPSKQLPHLNPMPRGAPSNFCLHRGSINDWFAQHGIIDFIQRIESWLNDAVADRLIRSNDEFEFTRIYNPVGFHVFDEHSLLQELQTLRNLKSGKAGYAYTWLELLHGTEFDPLINRKSVSFRHKIFINKEIEKATTTIKEFNNIKSEYVPTFTIGVCAFPKINTVCEEYFGEIPDTLSEFLTWTDDLGIPLRSALDEVNEKDLRILGGIPVSIVIKRPRKLLAHSSDVEIINFVILAHGEYAPNEQGFLPHSPVYLLDHRNPLTFSKAKELSDVTEVNDGRTLMLGCGALGSKLALHQVKGGKGNITFLDNDDLSPHNLVRHGLSSTSVGKNKANELKKEADRIFEADNSKSFEVIKESAIDLLVSNTLKLNDFRTFIDATASHSLFNLIVGYSFPKELSYFRAELVNKGYYGVLYSEGNGRAPRVDDLQMVLFDMAIEDVEISAWLKAELKGRESITTEKEDIMVGMSCNSDTIKLSDEIISFHASVMSNGIRSISKRGSLENGTIQLSKFDINGSYNPFSVQRISTKPFEVIKVKNQANWQVRVKSGVREQMFESLQEEFPNETGGLVFGNINLKRKIVYITRVSPPPIDSTKKPYLFVRGKKGVPQQVKKMRMHTGGTIDYVGEWHTHPQGAAIMSETDKQAVRELREFLDPVPYPTMILIVTPSKIHPYVFGPKHIVQL